MLEIQAGNLLVSRALLFGDRLPRKAVCSARPGFHLHEHDGVPIEGDDVRLPSDAGPIALDDVVATPHEVACGRLLALAAEVFVVHVLLAR